MTVAEFCTAVAEIGKKLGGSVTSWGRSTKHSTDVGGFAGDPHTLWLGVDMIYDGGPNRPGSADHPRFPRSCPSCSGNGLKVIHEKSHDHYQPLDLGATK